MALTNAGNASGAAPLDAGAASSRFDFYKSLGVGVAWTNGKTKRSTDKWNEVARPVTDADRGKFDARFETRNPVIVSDPPSGRRLFVVDCDSLDGEARFRSMCDTVTLSVKTPKGRHIIFDAPEGSEFTFAEFQDERTTVKTRQYIVGPGSVIAETGGMYLCDKPVREIVPIPFEVYEAIVTESRNGQRAALLDAEDGVTPGGRNQKIFEIARAKRGDNEPFDEVLEACLDYNQERCSPPLPESEVQTTVKGVFRNYEPDAPTTRTVRRPQLGEAGMADHFHRKHRGSFLHVNETEKWLHFLLTHWRELGALKYVREAMKDTILSVYDDCAANIDRDHAPQDDIDYAEAAEAFVKKHRVAIRALRDNALNIAEFDFRISLEQLDGDDTRLILPCANGVLDLETGKLRPGDPRDLITVGTRVQYLPDARSELWEDVFLPQAFGDKEMVRFMQRFAGLCLSGLTNEERLYVFEGTGRNGKGTFLDTIAAALGPELAAAIRFATLATSNRQETGSGPQADVIHVRGKRLVVASEKNESRALDEERVKKWTGGDRITARAPYGKNDVEFVLHAKIVLAVNHLPYINASDDAMRARLLRIPFRNQFLREHGNLDLTLKDRLKAPAELEGVLRWMVDGWREYRRIGLDPPQLVIDATNEYLAQMNPLADFIADECEAAPEYDQPSGTLREAYKDWTQSNFDRRRLSDTDFDRAMNALGYQKHEKSSGRFWRGVRLKGAVQ
jgi:putative DNA primase/helicase